VSATVEDEREEMDVSKPPVPPVPVSLMRSYHPPTRSRRSSFGTRVFTGGTAGTYNPYLDPNSTDAESVRLCRRPPEVERVVICISPRSLSVLATCLAQSLTSRVSVKAAMYGTGPRISPLFNQGTGVWRGCMHVTGDVDMRNEMADSVEILRSCFNSLQRFPRCGVH
jgi:hypothetical protein